jgi:hypothetical protein
MFNAMYRLRKGYKKTPKHLSSVEPLSGAKHEEEPRSFDYRVRRLKKTIDIILRHNSEECKEYYANRGVKFTFKDDIATGSTWSRITETKWGDLLRKHQRLLEDSKYLFRMLCIEEEVEAIPSKDQTTWVYQDSTINYQLLINGIEGFVEMESNIDFPKGQREDFDSQKIPYLEIASTPLVVMKENMIQDPAA